VCALQAETRVSDAENNVQLLQKEVDKLEGSFIYIYPEMPFCLLSKHFFIDANETQETV